MTTFEASAHIAADASVVWAALIHIDRWPSWDPALDRVDGTLGPEGRITIHVQDQSRPFKLAVTDWQPQRRLVLRGGLPLGLFTGTRTYGLTPSDPGTNVEMTERYTGPMASLIGKRLPDLQPSFEAFVDGWRKAAEG